MKKITTTPTLETLGKGDFRVDIQLDTKTSTYYAWLYHKDYCIKEMMFGCCPKTDGGADPLSVFERLVEGNLDVYIRSYKEDHMDH